MSRTQATRLARRIVAVLALAALAWPPGATAAVRWVADHDQGEVERRAADPVGGIGRAPLPRAPVGRDELDPQRRLGRLEAAVAVAEWAGPDADVADVAEAAGAGPLDAEGVGDVLPEGPGL